LAPAEALLREEAMTDNSFVDEMTTLLAELHARLEAVVGKPLSFALAVVHGDEGEGVFWFTSPNSPNQFSEPLAEALRRAADDLEDSGSKAPSGGSAH
jgi:hypothetical protein